MRPKTPWTPSSILLWLIAAVAATLVVCSEMPSEPGADPLPAEVEFEIDAQ